MYRSKRQGWGIAFRMVRLVVVLALVGAGGYVVGQAALGMDAPSAAAVTECSVARQLIAHEVIEGRLSLPAAIERYRSLSEARSDFSWKAFRMTYPGSSDEERFGHQVIAYVASALSKTPAEAETVVARLEGQLKGYTGHGSSSSNQ
jgi:hypothetical protein